MTNKEDEAAANGLVSEEFDDHASKNEVKDTTSFPKCRHVLVAMGFFAFINVYSLRVNLNVAMVAMVNDTWLELTKPQPSSNVSSVQQHECDAGGNETSAKTSEDGVFLWDTKAQNTILAAFFYGYITTQVIGGTLAQRIGGKWLLLLGIFITALLTLLTPVISVFGDYPAIVTIRILEGVCEGIAYPTMHAMLSEWAPPFEKSKMATTIYAGATMGTVISMPISGLLCQYLGWESVFYVFGVLGVVWSIMWFFLVFNSPAVHPRITSAEREYIESAMGKKAGAKKGTLSVPWLSVAKSVPVYALAFAHMCNNFGYYTLMTCLPQYLKNILHFDMKSNGVLSGAPYLLMWMCITGSGLVADMLRTKKIISTTNVRKLCNGIGFTIPGILLICTGYVGCNAPLAVGLIIVAIGISGVAFAGWSVNHLDLAPPYAGTLMGITNTLATIPGFVGPSIVGAITYQNHTVYAWRIVFFITAGIYAAGTVVYAIFGSGETQPWAVAPKPVEMQELKVVEKADDEKEKV